VVALRLRSGQWENAMAAWGQQQRHGPRCGRARQPQSQQPAARARTAANQPIDIEAEAEAEPKGIGRSTETQGNGRKTRGRELANRAPASRRWRPVCARPGRMASRLLRVVRM
jgi:hypothetical protein